MFQQSGPSEQSNRNQAYSSSIKPVLHNSRWHFSAVIGDCTNIMLVRTVNIGRRRDRQNEQSLLDLQHTWRPQYFSENRTWKILNNNETIIIFCNILASGTLLNCTIKPKSDGRFYRPIFVWHTSDKICRFYRRYFQQ